MLESKLSKEVKTKIRKTIETRVLEPVRKTINGENVPETHKNWFKSNSNWNPYCWHGIIISALVLIDDSIERDTFVLNAISNTNNYLDGFKRDGYSNEGMNFLLKIIMALLFEY
jgi:hypothetical protein